jgi:hypothetical protein
MSDQKNTDDSTRDLPISLLAIEPILRYLNQSKKLASIHIISESTGISMRVVKNILMQLEKFGQVERMIEDNKVMPKWRITKFGRRVIKKANGIDDDTKFLSIEDELLNNITIPSKMEELNERLELSHNQLIAALNKIQVELSKILGPIMNLNDPVFEDLISIIIKRVKSFKVFILALQKNPVESYLNVKEIDEKKKKLSKSEIQENYAEILFINLIILNQLNRIMNFIIRISKLLGNDAFKNAFMFTKDLREELRVLSNFLNIRKSIKIKQHIFNVEQLKRITKNHITTDLLEEIVEIPMNEDAKIQGIQEAIIEFVSFLNKNQKRLIDIGYEISENIPLYELYQIILDEKPNLSFTIEQLEKTINYLADQGYIPGITKIESDEDHYLKLVQLKTHDITKDESTLITLALRLQILSVVDIVKETGWSITKVEKMLEFLSESGILKHSKSFLHGDRWYIVSE